jgi:tetratricopeptide (TPR) repeat protein
MMKRKILFTAAIGAMAWALPANAFQDADKGQIVVTGKSLKDTAADLAACIARGCPPDEEIRAALAHAENQFIAGEYRDAKSTLYKTVGRNRKFGAQYPIAVSDLFRARSRVAEHLGEPNDFRASVLAMRDVLRENLPVGDARALVAQMEVGDSRAKLGFIDEAIAIFKDVEAQSLAAGHNRVAAYAKLRRMIAEYQYASINEARGEMNRAIAGLRELAKNPLPGTEDFALVAEVTLAGYDRRQGREDTTAAIVKRFAEKGGASRPLLLAAQPLKMPVGRYTREDDGLVQGIQNVGGKQLGSTDLRTLPANMERRWIDVGFWINPNGLVGDVEILRVSGGGTWTKWVTDSVKTRIYAPLATKGREASPGYYMVERYSLTANYLDKAVASNLERRGPTLKIVRMDITPENFDQPYQDSSAKPST